MKNRIASGFDFIAPFYDVLARVVIGKDIVNAQLHFLKSFKECNHILILGGGSGWILEPLCAACPDLQIDYIELSPRMINAAEKKSGKNGYVNFIQGTENDIPNRLYDGVITNFYLDMFAEQSLNNVIDKVKESLTSSALWVVTDFVDESAWNKMMLWLMYRFFRIIAWIEATHLPDWQDEMIHAGFTLSDSKKFKNGFIKSNLYRVATFS
jgi:tRNA (cmo5U34)-methyltransferase